MLLDKHRKFPTNSFSENDQLCVSYSCTASFCLWTYKLGFVDFQSMDCSESFHHVLKVHHISYCVICLSIAWLFICKRQVKTWSCGHRTIHSVCLYHMSIRDVILSFYNMLQSKSALFVWLGIYIYFFFWVQTINDILCWRPCSTMLMGGGGVFSVSNSKLVYQVALIETAQALMWIWLVLNGSISMQLNHKLI